MLRPELLSLLTAPGTDEPLELVAEGLRVRSTRRVYPVADGIPRFVDSAELRAEKKVLQTFYEDFGWQKKDAQASYNDQALFGFENPTLYKHRSLVNREQRRHFPPTGRYFLDCASGPVATEEYLEYSCGYDFHVCVDLAVSALKGARERLGDRGLYVNADGTRLPFRSNVFDTILSSHTLYHMPPDEQPNALHEFYRVLKPGGRCVIYYNVGEHSLFGRITFPLIWLRRGLERRRSGPRRMYSAHHPLRWFRGFVPPFSRVEFHVYRLLPNQVIKYALPATSWTNRLGDALLPRLRRLEERQALAPVAQYLTVVFDK